MDSTKCSLKLCKSHYKVLANSRKEVLTLAKVKANSTSNSTRKKRRPPLSPEARENQMISYAMDLVEQRLLDGSASSQETTHFLKLGSSKAQLEMEKLRSENEMLRAKTESIQSSQKVEELYTEALNAMRRYSGQDVAEEEDDENY